MVTHNCPPYPSNLKFIDLFVQGPLIPSFEAG
jgi:hypothetical protein